jgi:CRP/FNR family transcriptional regulator, cyclic AMP receptor protein
MVIDTLLEHPCFKTLDPESCRDLDRQRTWLTMPAGAWAVAPGEDDVEVCFVLAGRLRLSLHGSRQDAVPADIGAGSFFGELTALEGVPNSLSALTAHNSTLAKMPNPVFVATLFNYRPLGETVVAALVVRNRAKTRRVGETADTYGDGIASLGPRLGRSGRSRLDVRADVLHPSANQKRARRWS